MVHFFRVIISVRRNGENFESPSRPVVGAVEKDL